MVSTSQSALDNISISQSEVVEELLLLNVHKACGPDQMCPRLLKEEAEQLAPLPNEAI